MNAKIWQTPGFHCGQHKEEKKLMTFSSLAKKLIKLAKFFRTKLSIVDQFVLAFNMFPLAQTNVGSFINQL